MPTAVITIQAKVGSEVIYELPQRIKIPPPPIPSFASLPIPGFILELIADFLVFLDKVLAFIEEQRKELEEFLDSLILPCPLDIGFEFPLPSLILNKLPGLPAIPPIPPIPIPTFIIELILDFLELVDKILAFIEEQRKEFEEFLDSLILPCPLDIGFEFPLPALVISKLPAIPVIPPIPPIPVPVFILELIKDFLDLVDIILAFIEEVKAEAKELQDALTLPCPVNLGLPSITFDVSFEP